MTEDEEYLTTLLGIVELLQNGTDLLPRSWHDPVPRRLPPGVPGQRHPRRLERVRHRPRRRRSSCRATRPTRRSTRTAAFIEKWHGGLDGRIRAWAMAFSAETCQRRAAPGPQAAGRRARRRPDAAPPQRRRRRARRTRREYGTTPDRVPRADRRARPERAAGPRASASNDAEIDAIARTGTSVAMCPVTAMKEATGHRTERATCPSSWRTASTSRSAATRPTARTTWTWSAR